MDFALSFELIEALGKCEQKLSFVLNFVYKHEQTYGRCKSMYLFRATT